MKNEECALAIGFGQADITPNAPVAMIGLYSVRTTGEVFTPLLVVAMAMIGGGVEPVYWAACDLLYITDELINAVCLRLSAKLPGFRREQLMLSATHIHTGPFLKEKMDTTLLSFPAEVSGVLGAQQYCEYAADGIAQAILQAVENQEPVVTARVSANIKTGYCRRGVYTDGTAKMYPDVYSERFSHMESRDGGPVKMVYVLRKKDQTVKGVIVDVPCPAQADVRTPYIHADYWHYVRCYVKDRLDIPIFGVCACAGDLSPRDLYDLTDTDGAVRMKSLGIRIGKAVTQRCEELIPDETAFGHDFLELQLDQWNPTPAQYQSAKSICRQIYRQYDFQQGQSPFHKVGFPKYLFSEVETVVKRFEHKNCKVTVPIHALRLGKAVFITNPFECFTEYADRIAGMLPDTDLYDVQLTDQYHGYLPTQTAVYGGGYSACIYNGVCAPETGDVLVEQSVKLLKQLF